MSDTQHAAPDWSLITARVDDTYLADETGKKLGALHSFHIEPSRGQVRYAVISIGGMLGLGQSYHPVPFHLLRFDAEKGGYIAGFDKAVLDGSPSYRPDTAPQWDADYARRIENYYVDRQPRI